MPIDGLQAGGAGAFLDIPTSTTDEQVLGRGPLGLTPDPASLVKLPDGNPASTLTYDWSFHSWLPVAPDWVSPDGGWYAYTDSGGRIHTVDVGSQADRQLGTVANWVIISAAANGVYAASRDPKALTVGGLSLINLDGSVTKLSDRGFWAFAGHGAAWELANIDGPTPQPSFGGGWDTAEGNVLRRMDLDTGTVATWLNGPTVRLLSVDLSGHPVVVAGSAQVLVVESPGSAVTVGGGTFVANAHSDSHGTWFVETMTIAVYLIDGNRSRAVARYGSGSIVRIAGACE